MSIKIKFTLIIFSLVSFSIVVILFVSFLIQKNLLQKQFNENLQKTFKGLCYTCEGAARVKDETLIYNTLKSFIDTYNPQIIFAGYISADKDEPIIVVRDVGKEYEFKGRMFLQKESSVEKIVSSGGEEVLEYSEGLKSDDGEYLGSVKVGYSKSYLDNHMKSVMFLIIKNILFVGIVMIVISLGLTFFLTLYLIKPVRILTKAAKEVTKGNLNIKVGMRRKDEIGILSKTFDDMIQKVKQLDELKDSFVSSVSHELRSPLSAISGYVDLLMENINSGSINLEKAKKALSIIKDSVERLTTFINNILDLTKIKAGKLELRRSENKIENVILEVLSLFEPLALQQQKDLKVEIEPSLPSVYIDVERIKQVLINLVGNALKFTEPNGKIKIVARLVKENLLSKGYKIPVSNARDNFVEILVVDTGCGIPSDELDKIFDKFYQVGGTTPKKPKGTGLGLSIAAEIVKIHNGQIGVESVVGQGSTFKFVVPVYHPNKFGVFVR